MAIIHGFKSTTVWRAFILNSLATSMAIVVAIMIKMRYDTYVDEDGRRIKEITSDKSLLWTFTVTFLATFFTYTALHIIFGYGAGQLAD